MQNVTTYVLLEMPNMFLQMLYIIGKIVQILLSLKKNNFNTMLFIFWYYVIKFTEIFQFNHMTGYTCWFPVIWLKSLFFSKLSDLIAKIKRVSKLIFCINLVIFVQALCKQ